MQQQRKSPLLSAGAFAMWAVLACAAAVGAEEVDILSKKAGTTEDWMVANEQPVDCKPGCAKNGCYWAFPQGYCYDCAPGYAWEKTGVCKKVDGEPRRQGIDFTDPEVLDFLWIFGSKPYIPQFDPALGCAEGCKDNECFWGHCWACEDGYRHADWTCHPATA